MVTGRLHLLLYYTPMKSGGKGPSPYVVFLSRHCECSCKVISAFLESPDSKVQELAKKELQPLIDNGILKNPKPREQATQ